MICLLLPPSLLTPINLRRRRVFVSSLFSFFSVFLLVCFPSNIFSFILSRVLSPFFLLSFLFFRSLCIPQIVTSLSFFPGIFLSPSLSFSQSTLCIVALHSPLGRSSSRLHFRFNLPSACSLSSPW